MEGPTTADVVSPEQDAPRREMAEVVIETRNLTKVYRDFWGRQKVRALKALDLEIRRGEIFGLLGPNGSGKTTTIKLLLGLLFPTSGRAFVFDREASDVSKNARLGYLPEESYLYKFLNAEETLDFYGRLFDMPASERRQRVAEPGPAADFSSGKAPGAAPCRLEPGGLSAAGSGLPAGLGRPLLAPGGL